MSFRRYASTLLTAACICATALVVVAQDATPTMDPAMLPTSDPAAVPTADPMQGGMTGESAMAPIMDASGAQIGWASFTTSMGLSTGMGTDTTGDMTMTGNGKTLVTIQLNSATLTPGFHGMHLHMMGSCGDTGEGPFTAAGEHIPMEPVHPNHQGDFPSALVNADGTAYLSFETDRFTMTDLLDADGTAIIIHANPDNHSNIPERYGMPDEETLMTGDSGARIACGVLQAGTAGTMGGTGIGTDTSAPTMAPAMMPTTDPAAPTMDPAMMPTATTAG